MTTESHVDYIRHAPEAFRHLRQLSQSLHAGALGATLVELVSLRVSQVNGCAFCLDMHAVALRKGGMPQRKLDLLPAWRETDLFDARERAALEWAEALAAIGDGPLPDEALGRVRQHFDARELSELTFTVAMINAWNILNVGLRTPLPAQG